MRYSSFSLRLSGNMSRANANSTKAKGVRAVGERLRRLPPYVVQQLSAEQIFERSIHGWLKDAQVWPMLWCGRFQHPGQRLHKAFVIYRHSVRSSKNGLSVAEMQCLRP